MRFGRGQLVTRVLGVCAGLGFLALGAFALAGARGLDGTAGDRSAGFGIALVVIGIAAVVGSITVTDPSRIW